MRGASRKGKGAARGSGKGKRGGGLAVGGVAHVVVGLDGEALVELGLVVGLVLLGVVRVDGVRHVSGDEEALARRDRRVREVGRLKEGSRKVRGRFEEGSRKAQK